MDRGSGIEYIGGMARARTHLVAMTLMTLSVYAGSVTLGALRACAGREHTHAGVADPDCPMHHHEAPASSHAPGAHDRHHGHSATPSPDPGGARVTCDCSSDPSSPYAGPNALVAVKAALWPAAETSVAAAGGTGAPIEFPSVPTPPPPRTRLA